MVNLIDTKISPDTVTVMLSSWSQNENTWQECLILSLWWPINIIFFAGNLQERHYNKDNTLPDPYDIEQMNHFLNDAIQDLDLSVMTYKNFKEVGEVIATKLLMYNRRRTGEIEAVR